MSSSNGLSYTWNVTPVTASGANATFNLSNTQTVSVTAHVGACAETKSTVVTVNPRLLIKTFNIPTTPCFGGLTELVITNSQNDISYQLIDSVTGAAVGTSVSGNGGPIVMLTNNILGATNYQLNAVNTITGCHYNGMANVTVSPVSLPSLLAQNADSRTCLVGGNTWVVFTAPNSTRAIASIHPNNQYLGWVNITEYLVGNTIDVQYCGTDPINQPQFTTATVGRNWVIKPEFQPSSDVFVRVYIDEADFTATQANANGNLNPTFSELWLHGNSDEYNSPLPVVLKDFDVRCGDDGAILSWTTLSEVNNDYFSIQYSDNGSDWNELTRIKGYAKSNEPILY